MKGDTEKDVKGEIVFLSGSSDGNRSWKETTSLRDERGSGGWVAEGEKKERDAQDGGINEGWR